jgi:type II secretory pathway pseudopilin PulG
MVEMLIVMVMIAIVVTIAIPRINLSRLRSKAAMQALGTTMLALQREAIAKQYQIVVMIDTTNRALQVLYDSTNDLTINNGERVRTVSLGEEVVFGRPSAVTPRSFGSNPINFATTEISTGRPAIVLYRDGSAKEYGGLYLSTTKAMAGAPGHENETWAMEMVRATGRPEWLRWNGNAGWVRGF